MKKRSGTARALPVVAEAELATWTTRRLLARLERLRYCEDSLARSDMSAAEAMGVEGILFKDTELWRDAYAALKRILAAREHVPR